MARFLLKRMWGPASAPEMHDHALQSKRTRDASFLDITWDHSHVVADGDGRVISYCIYEAPSAERVLDHASATGGHFVDHVLALSDDVAGADEQVTPTGDPASRYLLVQRWADGVTPDEIDVDLHDAFARTPDVSWEHSHVGTDGEGHVVSHGVYFAVDDTVVRRQGASMTRSEIVELFEIAGDIRPGDLVG